ncbi:epidermal growth factor receptor kinase substrate 8-like isoform X4 [Homalodisca vitripennis]|uniref:epidermal growth factor receptor kinase substrate 8-like isoform X4 n=1 Tax=Homalodisca vitripennis TaxID=197043 RepID=UPI001EEBC38D|nr:epidermal growth factor receptor kinase substrate 8-like isoform X4 [Homalodisca vitripennis]
MPGLQEKKLETFSSSNRRVSSAEKMPYHKTSVHSNGYSTDEQQSGMGEDSPTYLMEHLATFTVTKETGIVYPADGMRRLLQLEKSNGIWSQKMQLRLDRNWVLIMDYETGQVMERFPASLIQEPTAFMSNDPMEIYNNILVFIVGEERQSNSHSEMHIFQCQSISSLELVEDLKLLRVGKMPGGRRTRHIPPPPPTPPPDPPINGVNVREQVNAFNAVSHHPEGRGGSELGVGRDDETSSTSSEKYGRDVAILNHCFDDIEKFIARLQHAAAASRELERRKRNRKSKRKDMGDGMLTMRAKPPPEAEFVDIFQKFKLSFNLLAKLKHHIHDPNAPELVHFLFTPLALIVDASHDTHYGPNLPSKVVSPLLSQEAVNLLINCVTSKETELWHSLGDAWLIPREQWKGYAPPPYHPVCIDGYPVTDEREQVGAAIGSAVASEAKRTRAEEIRAAQQDAELREAHYNREKELDDLYNNEYIVYDDERQEASPTDPGHYYPDTRNYPSRQDRYQLEDREYSQSPGGSDPDFPSPSQAPRDPSARSDISADSIERSGRVGGSGERFERSQARWLDELRASGAKIVQVTYPRTANNDKELTVIRGEYLEVLDDNRQWWKTRNSRGQIAHVPHTIVTAYHPSAGEQVIFSNPLYAQHFSQEREVRENTRSPPAPPPAPVPASADWVRNQRTGKKVFLVSDSNFEDDVFVTTPTSVTFEEPSDFQLMTMELRDRLMAFQKNAPNIKRTPVIYINSESTPSQVQDWLKQKGFDDQVSQYLKGMSGKEMFHLTKEELQKVYGYQEGHRLYSQLLLSGTVTKYNPNKSIELIEKLAKAKKKVDTNGEEDTQGQKTLKDN